MRPTEFNIALEHLNAGAEIEGIDYHRYTVVSRTGERITLRRYSETISIMYADMAAQKKLANNYFGLDQPGFKRWEMIQRSPMDILSYCNFHGYSDCEPYEVIKTISPVCVEVRCMDYEQTVKPTEFHIGGFSAHCADNHAQRYEYTSNPNNGTTKVRWSTAKKQWQDKHGRKFIMSDAPYRFYDYNF